LAKRCAASLLVRTIRAKGPCEHYRS